MPALIIFYQIILQHFYCQRILEPERPRKITNDCNGSLHLSAHKKHHNRKNTWRVYTKPPRQPIGSEKRGVSVDPFEEGLSGPDPQFGESG